MAQNINQLDKIGEPRSRSELFLNFLARKNIDINSLPSPRSRTEEYLEYLCYNLNSNNTGGGVINNISASNVLYDNTKTGLTSDNVQAAIDEMIENQKRSPLYGKKVLVYGAGFAGQTVWQDIVTKKLGVVINKLAHSTYPLTSVNDNVNQVLSAKVQLQALSNTINSDGIEILIVFAGDNDIDYDGVRKNKKSMSIGTTGDYNTETITGAMATVIKHIRTQHPDVELFICTLPNLKSGENNIVNIETEFKNAKNLSVIDISKAIRDTADFFSVPCIDIHSKSMITHYVRNKFLKAIASNGVAVLSDEGAKTIADVVVNSLLYNQKY